MVERKLKYYIPILLIANLVGIELSHAQVLPSEAIPTRSLGSCGAPIYPSASSGPPIRLLPLSWSNDERELHSFQISELRTNLNSRRTQCGLTTTAWDGRYPINSGSPVYASHIVEIRNSLRELFTSQSLPMPALTDPSLIGGRTTIKLTHLTEIKAALNSVRTCAIRNVCPIATFLQGNVCVPVSRVININRARGTFTDCLGSYKKCILLNSIYDGDGVGYCSIVRDPATQAWGSVIGDEGRRVPQRCHYACSNDDVGTSVGNTCVNSRGLTGVINSAGKCCYGLVQGYTPRYQNDMRCE